MVQRTPQFLSDDQPFGERGVVVRTIGSHGKELIGLPCQNYVLVPDFALDHSSILQAIDRKSLC